MTFVYSHHNMRLKLDNLMIAWQLYLRRESAILLPHLLKFPSHLTKRSDD